MLCSGWISTYLGRCDSSRAQGRYAWTCSKSFGNILVLQEKRHFPYYTFTPKWEHCEPTANNRLLETFKSSQLHLSYNNCNIYTNLFMFDAGPGAKFKTYCLTFQLSKGFSNATVRIFMAPKYDVGGKKLLGLDQQRHLFFALDTFTTQCNRLFICGLLDKADCHAFWIFVALVYLGPNIIKRKSKDSTFTKQSSKSFSDIEQELSRNRLEKPQCGCGHPHHLLLPRGTQAGMVFDLFVMVTNAKEDSVADGNLGDQSKNVCTQPYHWCGKPGQLYPDKRPMGYPFDRLPPTAAGGRLEKYVDLIPNSKTVQVCHR